jgi:hypothetical protein
MRDCMGVLYVRLHDGGVCAWFKGTALLPWVSHHTHHVRALASLALKEYHSAGGVYAAPDERLLSQAALAFMEQNEDVAKLHEHLHKLCATPPSDAAVAFTNELQRSCVSLMQRRRMQMRMRHVSAEGDAAAGSSKTSTSTG